MNEQTPEQGRRREGAGGWRQLPAATRRRRLGKFRISALGAALVLAGAIALAAALALAPLPPSSANDKNPVARDAQAIEAGQALFGERCAACHGQNAEGGMAANLRRSTVVQRGSDGALFKLIQEGIPGSEMVAQGLEENQVWPIVSYLHNLTRPGQQARVPGDPEAGRAVFDEAGCRGCHIIQGKGGVLGPELSGIAAEKTASEIREAVLYPGNEIRDGFESVEVKTREGRLIVGALRNEDNFSLQIVGRDSALHMLLREQTAAIEKPAGSLMPGEYGARLSATQLENLLAYLDQQRIPPIFVQSTIWNY